MMDLLRQQISELQMGKVQNGNSIVISKELNGILMIRITFTYGPGKYDSNVRFQQIMGYYIITIFECIHPRNRKRYGYYKPMMLEFQHLTYHLHIPDYSLPDQRTNWLNYGTWHLLNKDLVLFSLEISI